MSDGRGIAYTQPYGIPQDCFRCLGTGRDLTIEEEFKVRSLKGNYLLKLKNLLG